MNEFSTFLCPYGSHLRSGLPGGNMSERVSMRLGISLVLILGIQEPLPGLAVLNT